MRLPLVIFPIFTSFSFAQMAPKLTCRIDPKVNVNTIAEYIEKDEVGGVFAAACGRNRGIFVIEPADGHTYGCAKFPEVWNVTDANGIKKDPNPTHALEVLDHFIQSVYMSSPEYIRRKDPGACDMEAMSAYICGKEKPWKSVPWASKLNAPIRAVNIGGLFVMQRWITPGLIDWFGTGISNEKSFAEKCKQYKICDRLPQHWKNFYSANDFFQMKKLGLNSIRLPVAWWFFGGFPSMVLPDEDILDEYHPLTNIIRYAKSANLQVILEISQLTEMYTKNLEDTTVATSIAVASYINHIKKKFHLDNIMILGLSVVTSSITEEIAIFDKSIKKIRSIEPFLPIMVLESSQTTPSYDNVYLTTKVYHGMAVQDIASDTSAGDREKMFAHEKIACGYQAPLHFTTCTRAPTMIGEFSLAIENCMPYVDADYKDYGQCGRINERAASPWWQRSISSFAMRQISTYEKELGWAFLTYKLDNVAESKGYSSSSVYWSFRMAVAEGYINLLDQPLDQGCLWKPPNDFAKGDDNTTTTFQSAWQQAMAAETIGYQSLSLFSITSMVLMAGIMGLIVVRLRRNEESSYASIPMVHIASHSTSTSAVEA
eukprot:gene7992-16355_t